MKTKHIANTKRRIKNKIIILIFALIFTYSAYQVGIWLKGSIDTQRLEDDLFPTIVVQNEENKNTEIDFEKLEEINSDIIAWIKIENTNINYPILQGETDEFYLRKDIYKKYNFSGSIFVDSSTKSDFSDDNTVIYGHNLKNGKMFSQLTRIYNGDLGENIEVEIYTKTGINKYKVMSAYLGEQDLAITRKDFSDVQKKEFLDDTVDKSNIKFNYNEDYSKKIITLVTCDKSGKKRIVITALNE